MTHEQKKTNSEQSTENHEASFDMVHVPHSSGVNADSGTITKGFKAQNIQTTSGHTSHENGSVKKSAFVPVGCNTSHNTLNNGLLDNLKLGQKRKLQSLTSENFVSGLRLNDSKEKRFKSDETQSTYEHKGLYNEFNQPFCFGKKYFYYNPSFKQNAYSTLNGLNEFSTDVSKKLDFNFNGLPKDMSKHLSGLNDQEMGIDQGAMRTSNSQTNSVDLRNNLTRVGETKSKRLGEQSDVSFSKNTQGKTNVEYQRYEENFASNSQEFISLDSTKSSFLTFIKEMRQNAECNAIPCPFCSKTFFKYPDLKIHVQTHKYANISGNKIRRDEQSLCENQSPVSTINGNSMLTPVSSPAVHSPRPPSRRLSIGDDGMTRATSVIQFAEKKTKKSAGK